jgi:hypothetical protein
MLSTIEIISVKTQPKGWVLNGSMLVPDAPGNSEREAILAWIADGNTPFPLDAPTQEQLTQQSKIVVYSLLDQTAQQHDYRNFSEVVQFLNNGTWKAEAESLIMWQDAVWVKAYELLKSPVTSVDDFVTQLPKYDPYSKQYVSSITPRQVRLQLTAIGMRQAVEDYVSACTQDVKDWWEFSTSIERTSPLLIAAATQLGLSGNQLDQFFIDAGKL